MGVLVEVGGRRLCLEIDEAESVLYERGLPVQAGTALPGPRASPAPQTA